MLKQFRAIATRYDKTAWNFLAAIHLAAATRLRTSLGLYILDNSIQQGTGSY